MQDHAKVILDRIRKWRATQLTPWKAKASAVSTGAAGASPAGAGQAASGTAAEGADAAGGVDVSGPVAHVYGMYSDLNIKTDCLGLTHDGFVRLLTHANIIGVER